MKPNNTPPVSDTFACSIFGRFYYGYLIQVATRACQARYESRDGFFPHGTHGRAAIDVVGVLLTYLLPTPVAPGDLKETSPVFAEHLLDVIDKKTALRSDFLRTLLLASDRDVRVWAIQHSAIKSS